MIRRNEQHRNIDNTRRYARSAQADLAGIATLLDLLHEAETVDLLSVEGGVQVRAGIRSRCQTAIISLQLIAAEMGGER